MRTALARQLANLMLCGCCTITFAAVPVDHRSKNELNGKYQYEYENECGYDYENKNEDKDKNKNANKNERIEMRSCSKLLKEDKKEGVCIKESRFMVLV